MKRYNSYNALNAFVLSLDAWHFEPHKHNFYELICIEQGKGLHQINDMVFPYRSGDFFLLTPEDSHHFKIHEKTHFLYLKFTEKVFSERYPCRPKTVWENFLKTILSHHQIHPGNLISDPIDGAHALQLIQMLCQEFLNKQLFYYEVALELFDALMSILARAINTFPLDNKQPNKQQEKLATALSYIRQHILDKEKISIKAIADHLYMSTNYVSIYFKKHTGMSIKNHIIQAKIEHAKILLQQKNLTISQIADKLGFNDISHFNKIFRKYTLTNPSRFSAAP